MSRYAANANKKNKCYYNIGAFFVLFKKYFSNEIPKE